MPAIFRPPPQPTQPRRWVLPAAPGGTVPTAAPTAIRAVAGAGMATVQATVVPVANQGDSLITAYTAISTPGSFTGTVTNAAGFADGSKVFIPVQGLANGTGYTFTVVATNTSGSSAASSASSSVTPAAASTVWAAAAGNPQATGAGPTSPTEPWALRWITGPTAAGGLPATAPELAPPDGLCCTGNGMIFQPQGAEGLIAYNQADGTVAWFAHFSQGPDFQTAPVYDATTNTVLAVSRDGRLHQYNATTGAYIGIAWCGGRVDVAPCLDGAGHVATANEFGQLKRWTLSELADNPAVPDWTYTPSGTISADTPPVYSANRDVWVYCTNDLRVHCVRNATGVVNWAAFAPSGNTPNTPLNDPAMGNTFRHTWPVVAEQHGYVFVTQVLPFGMLQTDMTASETTSAALRTFMTANPTYRSVFCISLDDGSQPLGVLPIMFCGMESIRGKISGGDSCQWSAPPVVRVRPDGREVAVVLFRSYQPGVGGGGFQWWRGFLGEMALDTTTNVGQPTIVGGDIAHMQFARSGATGAIIGDSYQFIIDEQGTFSWLGDSVFASCWYATESARITDTPTAGLYPTARGTDPTNPIRMTMHPVMIQDSVVESDYRPASHWTAGHGGSIWLNSAASGRLWTVVSGGGYWTYWGVPEPPDQNLATGPHGETGPRPRYVLMDGTRMFIIRNGGQIACFDTSFNATPTTAITHSGPSVARANVLTDLLTVAVSPRPSLPSANITVTLTDGGAGGVFYQPDGTTTLTTLPLDGKSNVATYLYKPAVGATGSITLTATPAGGGFSTAQTVVLSVSGGGGTGGGRRRFQ